jgi:hypothetical protein
LAVPPHSSAVAWPTKGNFIGGVGNLIADESRA